MLRDFFSFSRSEQRALLVLIPIVTLLAFLLVIQREKEKKQELSEAVIYCDTTAIVSKPKNTPMALTTDSTLFAFNPNTTDSATLSSLGLSSFVTSNIIKYRQAGGQFRKADDLSRIYGMDSASFARLKPFIFIPAARTEDKPSHPVYVQKQKSEFIKDTFPTIPRKEENPYREYMANKLHEGEFLDINKADTADLKRIPGIGSYYASIIINYRRKLGGYTSLSQLRELNDKYDVANMPDNIGDWLIVKSTDLEKLNVNKASLRQLKDHPYIGYYRARAIIDLRQREGHITNIRQLSFLDEFSDEDILRLEPYLAF